MIDRLAVENPSAVQCVALWRLTTIGPEKRPCRAVPFEVDGFRQTFEQTCVSVRCAGSMSGPTLSGARKFCLRFPSVCLSESCLYRKPRLVERESELGMLIG